MFMDLFAPFAGETEERAIETPSPVALATARCLASSDGELLLTHLRRAFSDRRVPISASDAELRHLEGARSVVDHILRLRHQGSQQESSQ